MLIESLRIALRSFQSNKLRAILSMLGIIIGVGAVIAIVSTGSGAQDEVTGEIADLGSNLIQINPGDLFEPGENGLFTPELGQEILEASPAVTALVPVKQDTGNLVKNGEDLSTTAVGTGPEYQEIHNYQPQQGRFFNHNAVENQSNEMVLGAEVAQELFPGENPTGQNLRFIIRNRPHVFTIVGVMEESGTGLTGNLDDQVYIPYTTHMEKLTRTRYVDSFLAGGASAEEAEMALGQIEYFLELNLGDTDDFWIQSQDQILEVIEQVTGTMNIMLAGIAAISLLVGGIGIMNIMLVSVTERTREIGIRKAMGAKRGHILRQFLVEALCLSGLGGLLGIVVGRLGATAIAQFGGWEPVISPGAVALALGFALLIGLFFGIYPAYRASQLDPVQALSYE